MSDLGPPRGDAASSTFAVAVTRWGRPLAEEAAALGPMLGLSAYDARMRLGGHLPVVVAATTDPMAAGFIRQGLRDRGHGAVACDLARVASGREMHAPRDFELRPATFVGHDPDRGWVELPYAEIAAVVWARRVAVASVETEERSRKLSASRAVLTGGLLISRASVRKTTQEREEHEQVVYLFGQSGTGRVLLRESLLRYAGLGEGKRPTRSENFRALVEAVRLRTPGALFDARLVSAPPRGLEAGASVPPALAVLPDVDITDLSAHLVVIARREGQL